MARPVSWLPRVPDIMRSVKNSVRSHYDRGDIQNLFELQSRAASKLLELLPTMQVGTSRLVEREILLAFLGRVADADDVPTLLDQARAQKASVSRKKPRSLVRRDVAEAGLTCLPDTITLTRGRLEIRFLLLEDLANSLLLLARVMEREGDKMAKACELREREREPDDDGGAGEVRAMFEELERMEAEHAR